MLKANNISPSTKIIATSSLESNNNFTSTFTKTEEVNTINLYNQTYYAILMNSQIYRINHAYGMKKANVCFFVLVTLQLPFYIVLY